MTVNLFVGDSWRFRIRLCWILLTRGRVAITHCRVEFPS